MQLRSRCIEARLDTCEETPVPRTTHNQQRRGIALEFPFFQAGDGPRRGSSANPTETTVALHDGDREQRFRRRLRAVPPPGFRGSAGDAGRARSSGPERSNPSHAHSHASRTPHALDRRVQPRHVDTGHTAARGQQTPRAPGARLASAEHASGERGIWQSEANTPLRWVGSWTGWLRFLSGGSRIAR
jgi:hypothetical protein